MAFPLFFCKEITLGSVEDSLVHEQSQISSRDQHTRPFLKYVLSNVRWLGDSAAAWWATTNSWLSRMTLSDISSFSKKVFEAWRLDSAIFQIWLTNGSPVFPATAARRRAILGETAWKVGRASLLGGRHKKWLHYGEFIWHVPLFRSWIFLSMLRVSLILPFFPSSSSYPLPHPQN